MRRPPPKPRRHRPALTTIYAIVLLSALVLFSSLGVDYARVQVAKTELRRAADAAARAAAGRLSAGPTAARDAAVEFAAYNAADGAPVVLDRAADVELGRWDVAAQTFTVLTGSAESGANAVRVTAQRTAARGNPVSLALASIVGRTGCDVRASAIALANNGFGLVGLGSIVISGGGNTDSYDSRNGPYDPTTAGKLGTIASNGDITLSGGGAVDGDARPGTGKTVTLSGGATVSGSTAPLQTPLSFPPPTLPGSYIDSGAVSIGGGNYYVSPGDYYCTSLSISNKAMVYCTGPVRVFCSGPVSISGGFIFTYQQRPQNFQLNVINSSSVTLSGQADFYGVIYAPLSTIYQSGKADIYGAVVGNVLDFSGTWQGGVHYDTSLGTFGGTGAVAVVK